MGKEKYLDKRFLWKITFLFFLCSTVVRFYIGNYIKSIVVYPDELRYLHISRSLLESGRMLIRGGVLTFRRFYILC